MVLLTTGYIFIDLGGAWVSVSCWRLVLLTEWRKATMEEYNSFRLLLEIGSSNIRFEFQIRKQNVGFRLLLEIGSSNDVKNFTSERTGKVSVSCWRLVLLTQTA